MQYITRWCTSSVIEVTRLSWSTIKSRDATPAVLCTRLSSWYGLQVPSSRRWYYLMFDIWYAYCTHQMKWLNSFQVWYGNVEANISSVLMGAWWVVIYRSRTGAQRLILRPDSAHVNRNGCIAFECAVMVKHETDTATHVANIELADTTVYQSAPVSLQEVASKSECTATRYIRHAPDAGPDLGFTAHPLVWHTTSWHWLSQPYCAVW